MLRTPTLLLTTLALGCSFELNGPTPQHDAGPHEITCDAPGDCDLGQLAAGQRHTCVVVGEDALCFGDNGGGQSRPDLRDVVAAIGRVDQRVDFSGGPPSLDIGPVYAAAVPLRTDLLNRAYGPSSPAAPVAPVSTLETAVVANSVVIRPGSTRTRGE